MVPIFVGHPMQPNCDINIRVQYRTVPLYRNTILYCILYIVLYTVYCLLDIPLYCVSYRTAIPLLPVLLFYIHKNTSVFTF